MGLKNNKGITPIIAVILLLMMTIAIGGLAYVWIQRLSSTVQSGTENTSTQFLATSKVRLAIDGYNSTCMATAGTTSNNISLRFYGRNAGTEPARNVLLYVDDALSNVTVNSSIGAGVATSWGYPFFGDNCSVWVNKTRVIRLASDETSVERSFTFKCTTGSC